MIFDLATLAMAFMAYTSTATAQLTSPTYSIFDSADCEGTPFLSQAMAGVDTVADCTAPCFAIPIAKGSFTTNRTTTNSTESPDTVTIICSYYVKPNFRLPGQFAPSTNPCGTSTPYSQLRLSNSECQIVPPPPGETLTNETVVGVVCYANDCPN
jgi:hypothetical protein